MRNLLLIYRKLMKNKTVNSLGIAGLVVGLVCVVYIFFWITDEVSYDRFHSKLDRIFVVHAYLAEGKSEHTFRGCPPAVAPSLKNEYPEVEATCRYLPPYFQFLIAFGDKKNIEKTAMADFSLFDIFSFPFVYGDRGEENTPNRIILSETSAQRFFGKVNPVGKTVRLDNKADMLVVGVIRDIPHNSSISFDVLVPIDYIRTMYGSDNILSTWYDNSFSTFGLLKTPEGFNKVATSITRRIQKEMPESTNYLRAYMFEDTYLYEQKNIRTVRIFGLIALLVLVASTLNFINLSTARSSKQAKETGLRKTFGASKIHLVLLGYMDTAVICLLSFISAIILALIGLPFFNNLIGKEIDFNILFSWLPFLGLLSIYLVTVLLAGSYPAFFLSSFSPKQTLSSGFNAVKSRGLFRNTMVVVMFAISIVLLSSTLIISQQTRFLQRMDLGFEKDQLMYVKLNGKLKEQVNSLKEEIGRTPGVVSSTVMSYLPTMIGNNGEGWNWQGKDPNFKPLVTDWGTDENLLNTLGAKLIEGRYFNKHEDGIVINKAFADLIGWKSFAGKTLDAYGNHYRILGVVNNIHFNELSKSTMPMVIQYVGMNYNNYLVIKVNMKTIPTTLASIRNVCKTLEPDYPTEYAFLNDDYNELLASEKNLGKLVGVFSAFMVIVLCLGLLGVVLFLIEQKVKEIGIRKCLGESVISICARFVKPFIVLGILASLIAMPLTWLAMDRWLQNYAYRIDLSVWIFVFSGFVAIAIAVIAVLWQSWRAATINPLQALRYE
jgi:putative ABC transport system permease protein